MRRVILILLSATLLLGLIPCVSAADNTNTDAAAALMKPALIILAVILGLLFISCIVFTTMRAKNKGISRTKTAVLVALYAVTVFVLVCTILCAYRYRSVGSNLLGAQISSSALQSSSSETTTETTEETTEESTSEIVIPDPTYDPEKTQLSDPANWGISWDIISGGEIVDSYLRPETIVFGDASEYTAIEGVVTFRGDNYRSGATFGTAAVSEQTLSEKWRKSIGSLGWTGCGWTGQPLIVRWDEETKAIMNLYPEKKTKENLVEVIYATLDGYIYFYDLDDGSYTRDPLFIGMNFKGAGSLDPRGYPLMYVGSGDELNGKQPRMYIISLIDGSILFEQSGVDSFLRRWWYAFDSAPLVHAESDTLIWPGENGILYTIKLNTNYDKQAGTISIAPETAAKTRYTTNIGYSLGYESSAIVVGSYIYIADNGGMFFCVDLNTMELVWAQNTKDDVNATPVFEWGEDGNGYLYTATSMEHAGGTSYIYKLNAATGEIVWEKSYSGIVYNKDVSGGVLSSPLLGKKGTDLEGIIIYAVGKTPRASSGILVALDTQTGEVIWENEMRNYTWSSPVAVHTEEGKTYVVVCDSAGTATLLDGLTGQTLDTISLGSNVEASPAVFGDTIVVGTRGQRVYALKIS